MTGLCECGCGQRPKIAERSDKRKGWVKGQPQRFVRGHKALKAPLAERFWAKVDVRGPYDCWPWLGSLDKGYGQIGVRALSPQSAHRVVLQLGGVDPSGHHVHHRCENPGCVNPSHLELVAGPSEHKLHHRIEVCVHGHPMSGRNLYVVQRGKNKGQRGCRTCRARAARERYWRRKLNQAERSEAHIREELS